MDDHPIQEGQTLTGPIFNCQEVTRVAHCRLDVDAMKRPMVVREDSPPYGGKKP